MRIYSDPYEFGFGELDTDDKWSIEFIEKLEE